ncbi:hypothetical protein B0H16DRAFT_1415770 [Mycena metata]|uniref:Uncharacterized protein n=1 Tax=Mycena metata TaxID=1033252 RepID=A0AAD7J994_9AGAR|nr:hypothetical protein B0H16DRAFT_1415770 [Mycena metata]
MNYTHSFSPLQQTMGHVNMMADTVLVNASPEDLRAILRNMLSSKTPGLVAAFMTSTRARLYQRSGASVVDLVLKQPFSDAGDRPAPQLLDSLARARMLYGSGMGFASLTPLAVVVRSTIGHRWAAEGEVAQALVMVDADIAQALQSCKEELQSGATAGPAGRAAFEELAIALESSRRDVDTWGGEFPFERAVYTVHDFKL